MLQMRTLARNFLAASFGRQGDAAARPNAQTIHASAPPDDALEMEDDGFPDYCKFCRPGSGARPSLGGVSGRFTH